MLKLEHTKLKKHQTDFVNASKVIINKVLYEKNNISQRSKYQYYLNRDKIEDANKVTDAERNIKYSPIQTPLIIHSETSQLEHQEYKAEDLEQNIQELDNLTHLALLKRNRRSDSSDEDNQQLKNAKLFDVIRKKQSEKTIIEEIKRCLDDGAEINAQNTRGKAVLHIAVEKNYKDVVEFLLSRQIDINIPNNDGKTALDLAKHLHKQDIVQILENYNQELQSRALVLPLDAESGSKSADNEKIIVHQDIIHKKSNNLLPPDKTKLDNKEIQDTYRKGGTAGIEGSLYQIKLLTLFLYRGIKKSYSFRLATEMEDAGKFDDLVFKYSKADKTEESLCLQAKHRLDESKKISYEDLLTESGGDYSLIKYFFSYQDIIEQKSFGTIKEVIIYTNIDLAADVKLHVEAIKREEKDILNLENSSKQNIHYKFNEDFIKELRPKLENYKLSTLAIELINHTLDEKPIRLRKGSIFTDYELILAQEVIDVKNKKFQFYDKFIDKTQDLDSETRRFQEIYEQELQKRADKFRQVLNKKIEKLTVFERKEKRTRSEDKEFNKLKELKQYFENKILAEDYKFNLADLNKYIKNIELKLSNFGKRSNENVGWPQDTVSDGKVKEFLEHLIFAVNQPNEEELGDIIKNEVNKDSKFKDLTNELVADYIQKKMLEWFKEKSGGHGRFLTPNEGQNFLDEITHKIDGLISLGSSIEYCEKLKEYDIKFKDNITDDLKNFLFVENTEDKIFHLITSQDNVLSTIKLYQILEYQKYNNYLFIELSSLLRSNTQQHLMTVFNSNSHNLLVIECNIANKNIQELYNKLSNIIQANPSKKVILIAQEKDALANQFVTDPKYKDKYKKQDDINNFKDLTEESQNKLLAHEVTFQGEKISLNKLIDEQDDIKEIIDSETLVQLIKNEEIIIGKSPLRLSDLEAAYARIYEEMPVDNLVDTLSKASDQSSLFMISGINHNDIKVIQDELIRKLKIEGGNSAENANYIRQQVGLFKKDAVANTRIIITQGQDKEQHIKSFKSLCHNNPEKMVYWIEVTSQQVYLQQLYNPNFYLKRQFKYQIIIKNDIGEELSEDNPDSLFLFSGVDNLEDFEKILAFKSQNDDKKKEQLKQNIQSNKIILSQKANGQAKFDELVKNENKPIHWLHVDSNTDKQIIWRKSYGSLDILRKYVDKAQSKSELYDEDKFDKAIKNQVVIIADEPGMGKSTTLTSLSEQKLKMNWVIRIDFKDCQDKIALLPTNQEQQSYDIDKVLNFLSRVKSSGLNTDFAKKLTKYSLQRQKISDHKSLFLLFDGFDEINNDEHQEKIILLLKFLKEHTSATIWVSTRPYKMQDLENSLSTFAITFEEFKSEQQEQFLNDYWQVRLKLMLSQNNEKNYQSKLELYTKTLLEKVTHIFGENMSRFMGIPLQLRLLAEGFQSKVLIFAKSQEHEIPSFKDINILDIYKRFIDEKYKIYFKEKTQLGSSSQYTQNKLTKSFNKDHQYLAFSVLFPNAEQTKIFMGKHKLLTQEEENDLKSVGIIQSVGNEKNVYFIHKTFAEYFAATLFISCLDKKISNPSKYESIKGFLLKEMFKNSNEVIRNFIDRILAQDSLIHTAILDNNLPIVNDLLDKKNIDVTVDVDNLGRTALHLASQQGNIDIVKVLLAVGYNGLQSDSFGKTPLHYASRYGHSEIIEYLVNYYADIDINDNIFRTPLQIDMEIGNSVFNKAEYAQSQLVQFVNKQDNNGKASLYYAAEQKDWNIACILLLNGADSNALTEEKEKELLLYAAEQSGSAYANQYHKLWSIVGLLSIKVPDAVHDYREDYAYPRLLSSFFVHGHIKVVDALLNAIVDEEKRKRILNNGDNGKTPWDRVNYEGEFSDNEHLLAIKYLLKNGAIRTANNVDPIDQTLQSAAIRGHIETFKYLVEQGDKAEFNTYIGLASIENQFNIVEYLWQNYRQYTTNYDGITALHYAAYRGHLKSIKYLCDNGANVNIAANDGRTPLHFAAEKKRLDVITYLVSKGADVNIATQGGMTVLDYALKPLIPTLGGVPVQRDELGSIKYLITECNANVGSPDIDIATARKIFQATHSNVNVADQNGETLLHAAVKSKQVLFVKFLIKQGADVNAKDKYSSTPLHLAVKQYSFDNNIVKLLLQYGSVYDVLDVNKKTPLDLSKSYQAIELLHLIDSLFHSKNLMQDLENKLLGKQNPWHPDVYDASNPMLFILNVQNAQGKTLLHIAADMNDFAAIACLLKFNQQYLSIRDQYSHAKDYHSIDIAAKDSQGDTLLHRAAQQGNSEIVALLLKEGAIFDAKNSNGDIPEKLAKNNHHDNVVKLFQPTKDLFIAIKDNNILEVKNCISNGAYINAKNKSGKTPLHLASSSGQLDIVQLLLKNGADITAIDIQDWTALHFAAEKNQVEIINILLKNGAVFNAQNKQGKIPLDLVKNQNILKSVSQLFQDIQNPGNNPESIIGYLQTMKINNIEDLNTVINTHNNQGNTLLHYAAQKDYFDIVQFLLQNKAAYDVINTQYKTPARLAHHQDITNLLNFIDRLFPDESDAIIVHDNVKLTYSLKEIAEDPEKLSIITNVRNSNGQTILHKNLNYYRLKFLVKNGAKINATDKDGKTPLHFVAQKGKLELAKWLIEYGANANAIDNHGNTVLHEAASSGQLDLITWLVERQEVVIDTKNEDGKTPLHFVAQKGKLELAKWLIEYGANANAIDNHGNTVLHEAASSGQLDLIKWLVEKQGVNINTKNEDGKTPIFIAGHNNHKDVVKFLIERINPSQDIHIPVKSKQYDMKDLIDTQIKRLTTEQEKEVLESLNSSIGSSSCSSGANSSHSRKKRAIWSCSEREEESGKQQVVKVGKWHEVVRWLIEEKGADINAKDEFGRTILHKVAEFGHLDLVKWLMEEQGADVNTLDKYDTSLLHFATASGNVALVKWLVEEKHLAINAQDKFGKSALHFAALYNYQDIVKLLVAKNADINLRDRNGETALDFARKEQHQEMIKQLQKASIELENKQYIEISLDNLTELRKEQKEIGLKPSGSASTFGCNTQYRTKRHIGSCQEEESNNVLYEPLEESVPVEQVRASRIYSQISMAVILKNADQFSSGNNALDHILTYNKYIGEIIAEQKANNSPREQRILASHYQQAQQFLKDYPETKLLKKIVRNSDEVVNIDDNQSWLFDNGQQSMLVFQEGNHYGLYSQDFNYKQKFYTKEKLTFAQLEGFIKAFFKWHSGSSKYQTFTLADTLPAKLIKQLKLAKFWHAEQVAPDNILLHEQHLGLIESISALVIRKLFLLHGQSPDIAGLHADFFAHNKNNISLRFEVLHKVLPSLNAEQIQGLMAVIKKYNIAIDRTYLDTLSGDEKSLLELYYNKVTNKLKTDVAITPQLLSELSWESLSDGVANHPDISHELASKIVNSNKQVHEAASKGAVLKGMATQGLFFLPDIIRAANSGDISNLEQTGAMIAGDAAINHLYGALVSKLATIIPAGQAELLGKLPVTSPIFKALTIYSIVELHKQLASLPANSEERSIIKHKLGEQYFTAGLMVAELLGFEVTPLWIGLIAEQLIFDATSFRKQNHLDIPFWEALAMSLGFEQDKLQNILEERQLVEMNLELVNQINNQTQIPYGLTIVKIPKLGKLKWQNINQDQIPAAISNKINNMQEEVISKINSPEQRILESDGFRQVNNYHTINNYFAMDGDVTRYRGDLKSSIWQKASYDAYPQKSKLTFALHYNNMDSFKHEDNIFLDQLSVNNVTYQRIPSKATGIFLNGQDVLKRSEAEAAAVYLNAKAYHNANAQSNFYVGFDPREGDIELEFTSQGLERIDTMNVMRYFATKNIAMHNSLNNTSPYMITVQLANKPYPDSLEFAKDKGAFSVRDNSQRIISQYMINDNIDYIIKDFTSATRISFISNLEQQEICNTIRSEPNTIFILKWQCNNKMVNGKNQIEYLNLTDISGRILISDNKKYLQLILNNHVIDSHLRVSAEHIDIIEAQGRLDKNSKIDIMQAVNSFNVTLRGDIIVSDQATYLQMQGEVAGILPAIIYAKSAHNKVISLYEFNIDNLQPILETMLRSNASEFMDIKFSSNDVQYHWHNKLPINNTLQLAGRLDGKRALLQIELKSNSLRVFNDDNSIATTQIAHYDTNAILENGLILQKIFRTIEPNVTVTSNSELLTSTDRGNMLEFNIAGYYGQADVLEFQAPAGYFIYHYFPINRIIKLNNINYIVKNQMICASSAWQTIINGYELIKYGTISNLGNIEQMVGICFPHLLAESKILVKNDTLRINNLTLKSLEDSTKLYFNETEILSVKTLKDSLAKNQISNVTASNTKHIGKQNIAAHAGQEYLVNLNNSSRTINYNQLNKATIILNNIQTGELKVTANNNDLLFVASSSNHTLRIKNWPSNEVNNSDNRIVTLKFDQLLPAIEIRAINKLKLSEIAKIQNLVSKAELAYAITNKLEQLDAKMINDLKYLLVSNHKVGLTGNNHCLGLKSSAEQQEFISSYGQHYNQEQLQKILNHDQIIKALTWLIAKDYNDLSLQEPSKEKTELITAINKCYKEVISGKIIHRLLKHLEEGHAIAKIERFIEHHEQELKQKITAEFKASKVASSSFITESITEILDSEIPQHVRGRRAIDVQNEHDDEVENINDTIITSTATSMQSPMNNMYTMTDIIA